MSQETFQLRTALSKNIRVCFTGSSIKIHSYCQRFILYRITVLDTFLTYALSSPVLGPQEAVAVGSLALWLAVRLANGANQQMVGVREGTGFRPLTSQSSPCSPQGPASLHQGLAQLLLSGCAPELRVTSPFLTPLSLRLARAPNHL